MSDTPPLGINPVITVFGDGENRTVTKAVWSLLAGQDVNIKTAENLDDLVAMAPDSLLVFVVLQGQGDENAAVASILNRHPDVVCSVIAVISDVPSEQRLTIMESGFDSLFTLKLIQEPTFRKILLNKIAKGRIRLNNKIFSEEYHAFRGALAASAAAFIVFDRNRKLFYVSEHYLKAYPKWGHKLVRGIDVMQAYQLYCEEEGFSAETSPYYDQLTNFWERLEGETDFYSSDQRIFRLRARKLPQDQGTIVITTNITEHVRIQEELKEKSQALSEALQSEKEASEIQKQFIHMVSHEFRTPLSIIDGHAQIFFRRPDAMTPPDIVKRAKIIRSAVTRLVTLMEGILSSNMLKTGKLQLVPEPIPIKQFVEELCEEYTTLSRRSAITCSLNDVPETAMLDRKVFTLVLSNLLSNAVKFSRDEPDITVLGRGVNGALYLTITDNGVGIPEVEIQKIFDRYYRASTSSAVPGTGIGLNLVRDLIKLHKGNITITSKEGEGTTVEFSLPYLTS